MKEKVAQAIEKRGKAKVHDAAQKLREAAKKFTGDCGFICNINPKKIAETLRCLADEFDGTTKAFIVPTYFWDQANQKAYEEFMKQFDAMTRFVNQGIEFKDGNCVMPGEEPGEQIIADIYLPTDNPDDDPF